MLLNYDTLTKTFKPEVIEALVEDWLVRQIDQDCSKEHFRKYQQQAMEKLKTGELLVEYGENNESFTLVPKSKLNDMMV